MAVAVISHFPDLSLATYDDVVASLELDANPPAGAILHVASGDEAGVVFSEIWQTEQTFRAFHDYRLVPALRLHGVVRAPVIEIEPLHNVYAPEMFAIERMGAVSLPLHSASSPL